MSTLFSQQSIKIIQDMDRAIVVMQDAGKWLLESGKNPSKWWHPRHMNREFLLQHAEPNEFYVALINGKPAVAAILQNNQRNQSWKSVDKDELPSALYIHWLCVDRQFAGINLPKIMIAFAEKQAHKKNIKLLRLDTNADEIKLKNIYEKLGFHLMGVEQKGHHKTAFYQKSVSIE